MNIIKDISTITAIEPNSLVNADCIEAMKLIPDKSIGFICVDLPFGTTASQWDKIIPMDKMWAEFNRIIIPDRAMALFCNGQFMPKLLLSNTTQFKQDLIWYKSKRGNFINAKNRFMTAHETILIFSQADTANGSKLKMLYNPQGLIPKHREYDGRKGMGTMCGSRKSHKEHCVSEFTGYPHDVLEFASETKIQHPTQKPVPLIEYLIKTYSNEGDTVLDCCMGSGTAGVAAVRANRKFIGIELDPTYFELGCQRIENEQKKLRLF